ncbi:hypothetical protein C8R43DRAFT_1112682 [Mycena crocata]|nr:hypothetical protein C8R43DRAFT_1112682 [Mycena crocata]
MPLARANTTFRNSSRSPLPPSPRPPTFLPPSHYAEAGGLSPRPPTRSDSLSSSSSSHSQQHQTRLESRRNSAFMPISSNSDSSFEFGQKPTPAEGRRESKRFSMSGGGSKSGGAKTSASKTPSYSQVKRESHMTNLPLVEAQLLPSLRDTIDRMTRPPSRMFPPSSPPANDANVYEPSPESAASRTRQRSTPTQRSIDSTNSFSPPPPPSTPKPLKSALRPPTPKLQLSSPRSPAGSSRLTSGPEIALASGPVSTDAAALAPPPIRSRPRSRTDPGAPPHVPFSSAPTTPIPKSDPQFGAKGTLTASGIPRLRPMPGLRSASSTPRPRPHETDGHDSASDLELRYELEARDRRSLRVVNGVTSSESESDGEPPASIGLGLGLESPYASRSFASKLRARFAGSSAGSTGSEHATDDTAERRRKELLGLVKGLDRLAFQGQSAHSKDGSSDHEYGVVVSGSGRVDFGVSTSQAEPPRVMVSSSSGTDGELERAAGYTEREQKRARPTSLWKRSRSLSPAPPPAPPPQEHRIPESGRRKSPSRSPVIRKTPQSISRDESLDLIPDALRRHSVYHHASSSRPISSANSTAAAEPHFADEEEYNILTRSPESVYDEEPDDETWPEESYVQDPPPASHLRAGDHHRQSRFHRHSDDLATSDTAMLALHSRLAAARDREALGIPPSASDACAGDGDSGRGERMSYMDSGSSLARVGLAWENADGRGSDRRAGLSFGAEKLFRTLSGRTIETHGERGIFSGDTGGAFGEDVILKGCATVRPSSLTFSQSSSASSMYEDDENDHALEPPEESWQGEEALIEAEDNSADEEESLRDEPADDAWRSTLTPATYAAVVDRYGTLELRRQEAIHALFITEESFVARLTNTIQTFILPLRVQDSKCYIAGVPAEIARLFDWLEDILNLHTQLLSALRSMREAQFPVIEDVAEAIRESFVKQLEVYQPYLARLVNVAGTIARLVADTTSDFGEFVRIQERVRECRGWSLESLLVDPVSRLGKYPAIFRKLHEYTPKIHRDYVATFALLHSTELVIKVMTEVKNREDEYDLVKSISKRIKGLPSSVPLARRGRRLLFHGQLLWVRPDSQRLQGTTTALPENRSGYIDGQRLHPQGNTASPRRSSKLVDAIHDWDQRRARSGSVKSNVSSGTTASFSSHSTNSSSASSEPPLTPSSTHFASRSSIQMPRSKAPTSHQRPSPHKAGSMDDQSGESQLVQVFIFTDMVVVARVCKSRCYNGSEEWSLLENTGVAKVLGVTEVPDETNKISPLLVVDLIPLDIKSSSQSVVSQNVPLEVLHLRVPTLDSSTSTEELYRTCLAALQRSLNLTLRSISIPGACLVTPPSADLDWSSCSGGPMSQRHLPKSPSLIAEIRPGDSSGPTRQEREERGWWSSCFHQVLKEFQSRNVS